MTCKQIWSEMTDTQKDFAKRIFGEGLEEVVNEKSELQELAKNALLTSKNNCK